MAEPKGRPKTLVRRHVLEIKEDTREWLEEILARFTDKRTYGKTSRVVGAAIAAAGVYAMVRLVDEFGRGIVEGLKGLTKDIFTGVSVPVINVFLAIFSLRAGAPLQVEVDADGLPVEPPLAIKDLARFDPFAFGAALTAGGMVLAGLNPGEILKGIGSIIDALIPL